MRRDAVPGMTAASVRRVRRATLPCLSVLLCATAARAADPADALVSAAHDNSFLLQEAYNQDAGVVQTIASFELDADSGSREWTFALSQEWPLFTSDHQLSFTVPVEVVAGDAESASGVGDLVLGYRYQLSRETERRPAIAPYFAISLPTGRERDGLGDGALGYQFALPVSKVLGDRLSVHANAGVSVVPHTQGAVLDDYWGGASAVFALSSSTYAVVEWLAGSDQTLEDDHHSERDFTSRIAPGARYALSFAGGQLVIGAAAPIGTTPESPDWGVFLYLSFERRVWSSDAMPSTPAAASPP